MRLRLPYGSIHLEEYELDARDTKLGPEEITRDIPNVGEDALNPPAANGAVRRGIIELGKSLLKMPIELLPGVKETLKVLKEKGKYKLVVATKGDLLDQENKLGRSGLASYFDHIEVMSDKTEKEYQRMLNILQIAPSEFVMIGNSLKSDIQPVLSLGGYGIHIPFEVMWKHEVVDTFTHDHLKQVKRFDELLLWF